MCKSMLLLMAAAGAIAGLAPLTLLLLLAQEARGEKNDKTLGENGGGGAFAGAPSPAGHLWNRLPGAVVDDHHPHHHRLW